VFTSIRKFLQFQLTVNFVALVVSFIGALVGGRMPLNVLQLLWVNLIMDTLGALALATETPSPKLLDDKPHGRSEPLINGKMFKHIVAQGFYQMFWMFLFLYGLPVFMSRYAYTDRCTMYSWDNGNYCVATVGQQQLGMSQADAAAACDVAVKCGYPCGSSSTCPVASLQNGNGNVQAALCGNDGSSSCAAFDNYSRLTSQLNRNLVTQHDKDFLKVASLLFNTFIMAQICNLINSRRINDEYNVFEDLHKSPLFLMILGIIITAQVLIINFLGPIFKVQPLAWDEWLVCIAIGIGAMIWSQIVRFVSRNTSCCDGGCGGGFIAQRLARMNQVKSKHLKASDLYSSKDGLEMSVQEAVMTARAGTKAAEEKEKAAEEKKETKKRWRFGKAGSKEERTFSGRSDSAGSLGDNLRDCVPRVV
jgi:Ca2+-transporting ATPase